MVWGIVGIVRPNTSVSRLRFEASDARAPLVVCPGGLQSGYDRFEATVQRLRSDDGDIAAITPRRIRRDEDDGTSGGVPWR